MIDRIALIGFMGAGKSTMAHQLARELGWNHCDLDEHIGATYGATYGSTDGANIAQIFRTIGESGFRDLEHQMMVRVPVKTVVALGGGAFIQARNRIWLKRNALTVFLDWPCDVLLHRLEEDPNRPLATPWRLRSLFRRRHSLYSAADVVLRLPFAELGPQMRCASQAVKCAILKRNR